MALNIFPRRRDVAPETPAAPAPETLPEPSPEVLAEAEAPRPAARRTRSTRAAKETAAAVQAATPAEGEAAEEAPKPARRTRTRAARAEAPAEEPVVEVPEAPEVSAPETAAEPVGGDDDEASADHPPSSRRRRGGRGRGGRGAGAAATALADGAAPVDDEISSEPVRALSGSPGDINVLVRAIERQTRQLEQHSRQIEQLLKERGSGPATGGAVANRPRVGIFVDVANVELASDRLRARFDWGKILALLTEGRTLVRAVAYSPVHDDPHVSIETQRFVEPFLDKGYKIVTKPLKRFQDGTIKANVDVELALDVMAMLDRLDVVCLVSGDGDFQRLVEVVQSRGVQVDVVSVSQSTASNLRNAADRFIDLGARLREVRI